jgi:hypothetical protein
MALAIRFLLLFGLALFTAKTTLRADEQPQVGHAKKDGLSLTVSLDKDTFGPADEIVVTFKLKNETEKDLFLGDGYLAPDYHEAGPGRHFEVHVTTEKKVPLRFWSGTGTEGTTSGIRKVFLLKPGKTYEGSIRLSAGAKNDAEFATGPHGIRGGSFENTKTRRRHVLGADGQKYTLSLRYQVDPKSHGVWKPPADFKEDLLWKGVLTSSPIEFKVSRRLSAAEKTTVVQRLADRKRTLGPGLDTKFEGLAVALLGSCSLEDGVEIACKERWEEALNGEHILVSYPKPRLFSVNADESDLYALEILVPIGPAKRPDHIFVRDGDWYRAFAKYDSELCTAFMKQLERMLPPMPGKRSAG